MAEKKAVLNPRSGKIESYQGTTSSLKVNKQSNILQDDIPDYDAKLKEKETPLESLVKKFER